MFVISPKIDLNQVALIYSWTTYAKHKNWMYIGFWEMSY